MSKTLPDYILDGSITVNSVEAFNNILQLFPDEPELVRMQADLFAGQDLREAAAGCYDQAARLFLCSGRLLQAIVCKMLEWRLFKPSRSSVLKFHLAVEVAAHVDRPLDIFLQNLSPQERMAVFARFERFWVLAGRTFKKPGEPERSLCMVVSGKLKESCSQTIDPKSGIRRESSRVLDAGGVFGEVYPLQEAGLTLSTVEALVRSELVAIPKRRLIQLCWKYPDVQQGIMQLCRLNAESNPELLSDLSRKGERYRVPVKMSVEVLPCSEKEEPIVLNGYSRDLSISGVSFVSEVNPIEDAARLSFLPQRIEARRANVTLAAEEISITISGRVIRCRKAIVDGGRTLVLGIHFAEIPPRLRGTFFSIARTVDHFRYQLSA
jgi:hypothetical protein